MQHTHTQTHALTHTHTHRPCCACMEALVSQGPCPVTSPLRHGIRVLPLTLCCRYCRIGVYVLRECVYVHESVCACVLRVCVCVLRVCVFVCV